MLHNVSLHTLENIGDLHALIYLILFVSLHSLLSRGKMQFKNVSWASLRVCQNYMSFMIIKP